MNFKKYINKSTFIFIAALVTPGGFIALGLWKAYKIYQKKQEEKKLKPKTFEEFVEKLKKDIEEDSE
jgi:predicted negative regulator of RcsB-dependent stress response